MKTQIARITLLTVAILSVGLGCKTTIIEPGTQRSATYRMGKLTAQEPQGINAVYQATEKAMADLGLSVVQKLKDELQAQVVARDAQDKKITVRLLAITKETTQVTIDVGSVEKANRIYQTIRDNLQ